MLMHFWYLFRKSYDILISINNIVNESTTNHLQYQSNTKLFANSNEIVKNTEVKNSSNILR